MSDLSECCYGMGFGPEGDGVELMPRIERIWCNHVLVYTAPPKSGSFEGVQWPQWLFDDKPESNAKPSLPALTRQAGEKYKGPLAFCHADD